MSYTNCVRDGKDNVWCWDEEAQDFVKFVGAQHVSIDCVPVDVIKKLMSRLEHKEQE